MEKRLESKANFIKKEREMEKTYAHMRDMIQLFKHWKRSSMPIKLFPPPRIRKY